VVVGCHLYYLPRQLIPDVEMYTPSRIARFVVVIPSPEGRRHHASFRPFHSRSNQCLGMILPAGTCRDYHLATLVVHQLCTVYMHIHHTTYTVVSITHQAPGTGLLLLEDLERHAIDKTRPASGDVGSHWCAQRLGALRAGVHVRVSLPRGSGDRNPTDPSHTPVFGSPSFASPVPAPAPAPYYHPAFGMSQLCREL
jgi:hypothetical protein